MIPQQEGHKKILLQLNYQNEEEKMSVFSIKITRSFFGIVRVILPESTKTKKLSFFTRTICTRTVQPLVCGNSQ